MAVFGQCNSNHMPGEESRQIHFPQRQKVSKWHLLVIVMDLSPQTRHWPNLKHNCNVSPENHSTHGPGHLRSFKSSHPFSLLISRGWEIRGRECTAGGFHLASQLLCLSLRRGGGAQTGPVEAECSHLPPTPVDCFHLASSGPQPPPL